MGEMDLQPGRNHNLFIILNRPQLAENIGMSIRAMVNCGFFNLRIVSPQCEWPNKAVDLCSAEKLSMVNVQIFSSFDDAIADLNCIFATTARCRHMIKETLTPRSAASRIQQVSGNIGIVFGAEQSGLTNDDVAKCSSVVEIPSIGFSSYNLAQAVLVICYEMMIASGDYSDSFHFGKTKSASHKEISGFVDFFSSVLSECGYFDIEAKRDQMIQTIKNFFIRSVPTTQEINSLFGAIKALVKNEK